MLERRQGLGRTSAVGVPGSWWGDWQRSRRRGCGAVRPRQEMPNLEDLSLRISAPPLCLTQADLSNCDMTDTMLDYVVLRGANLRGSIAVNANFIRSDLGEIDATDADFTDAIIDKVLSLRARKPLWGVGGSAASVPT